MFVRKFNARDWQAYKALRLEALRLHADVFGGSYETESALSDKDWKQLLSKPGQAFFGLYDDEKLIGSAGVFTDWQDAKGKTALLVGSYIREAYRGQKLSHLLYAHRINWIINSGLFNRVVVGHKQGNEASRRANQAFGFEYTGHEERMWGNGSKGDLMIYEMRLAT